MMLQRVITNVPYIMQAMISWSIILLRTKIGLGQSSPLVITILFLVCMIPALVWLLRTRAMTIALIALAWWVALSVPMLLLYETYLLNSPRLLYTPAIGIALFWGAVTALLLQHLRHPVAKVVLAVPVVVMLAWCVPYITDRMDETARLTPAMETIDADLRASDKSAKVLFINLPEWSAPSYPAFLTGAEGMPHLPERGYTGVDVDLYGEWHASRNYLCEARYLTDTWRSVLLRDTGCDDQRYRLTRKAP